MSCCCFCCVRMNKIAREQRRINRDIDTMLKREQRASRKHIKILLLGAGESGKSTFLRQMRIIHGEGFDTRSRASYAAVVRQNVWVALRAMLCAMTSLRISYAGGAAHEALARELHALIEAHEAVDGQREREEEGREGGNGRIGRESREQRVSNGLEAPHTLRAIQTLWLDDAGFRECYLRRREYQLTDSAKYYLDNLSRIAAPDYLPNVQDILHVRAPTEGIVEYNFSVNSILFRMVDVGGQRSERRKWIHCFEGVTSILFLSAISEYDQVLTESDNENRLEESKALFTTIILSKWFSSTSVMLFLNKLDLFVEKIKTSAPPLSNIYPEFADGSDVAAAQKFVLDMFSRICERINNRIVYPHFTSATDTDNINNVFADVKDTILHNSLHDYNLL